MKWLLNEALKVLQPLGYKRLKTRFFKFDNEVFKQIDFQRGANGSYFFVNVCLHPVGLPELLAGKLVIPDRPSEHECIISRRIEAIVLDGATAAFRSRLVSCEDEQAVTQILQSLSTNVQSWLSEWVHSIRF
jgi:hypothetical protein